jgi:hypothetical protein
MIDHVLGRPSVKSRRLQVLAVLAFWSTYVFKYVCPFRCPSLYRDSNPVAGATSMDPQSSASCLEYCPSP